MLAFLPGTCSQLVPTGISSVMPARTCTFHLLSSAHSIWSLGLEWMLTNVTPAGCKKEEPFLREGGGGACDFWREQGQKVWGRHGTGGAGEAEWTSQGETPSLPRQANPDRGTAHHTRKPSSSAAACPEGQRGRDGPEGRRRQEAYTGSWAGTGRWRQRAATEKWRQRAATEEHGVAAAHVSASWQVRSGKGRQALGKQVVQDPGLGGSAHVQAHGHTLPAPS